jgi:hypothetical protein
VTSPAATAPFPEITSPSHNYFRYVLYKLIDSLDRPYYRTALAPDETTGLNPEACRWTLLIGERQSPHITSQ